MAQHNTNRTIIIIGIISVILTILIILMLSKCEMPEPAEVVGPPSVEYMNEGEVARVTYDDEDYLLYCNRAHGADVPFDYYFEDDCEINIRVDGRQYDFDSPYDVEQDEQFGMEEFLVGALIGSSMTKKKKKKVVKKAPVAKAPTLRKIDQKKAPKKSSSWGTSSYKKSSSSSYKSSSRRK